MDTVIVNFGEFIGKIKPMHAVNNGPMAASKVEQTRGNFEAYKAARIPYARNHDASFCSAYGGEHTVDVHAIFPDFTKNPYNPESYDFVLTDDYLKCIIDAGTKVFYRLGSKIEHWRKKYGTIVPDDFKKWAVVCEHIIRHYNEGWANGFNYDIEYWEIWNEPDGKKPNGDQPNWSGTPEQFYEFYKIAATHLKKCFPNLKIGGPALSWVKNIEWFDGFLKAITQDEEKIPLDFFSWHEYTDDTKKMLRDSEIVRKRLNDAGYDYTESILNEWNYLEGWTDKFISSIEGIIGMRGAAFTGACMATGQKNSIDMMMYYDARPSVFNGIFDFYTMKPLKGYYPFVMYSDLYDIENEVQSQSSCEDIYVVAASDYDKKALMITYYSPSKDVVSKDVIIKLKEEKSKNWNVEILDKEHTMEKKSIISKDGEIQVNIKPDSILYIRNEG